jgi:hypothetical protein
MARFRPKGFSLGLVLLSVVFASGVHGQTKTWRPGNHAVPLQFSTPAAGLATDLANAMAVNPALITNATFVAVPPIGTPNAVSSTPLASFPTNGSTYAILTTGDANLAGTQNTSGSSGVNVNGPNVRGNTDYDVTILKIDLNVPADANCVSFEFRFLSEEYAEFVGSSFNDAFIAEMDTSNWTTSGSTINAPNNFAFDPAGKVISVNAAGTTSMSTGQAAGTTYDGATPRLSASKTVTPGPHSLYLSIFDQADHIYDSAVFIDKLTVGNLAQGTCTAGAQTVKQRGDATGDGKADLFTRDGQALIQTYPSTGTAFAAPTTWTSGFVAYRYDVYFADVDGDNKTDLIARNKETGTVEVYRSTGTAFTYALGTGPGGVWSYGWGTSYSLFFADANGDGKDDLIGRYDGNGDVYVFLSTGSGFSSAAPSGLWTYGWSAGYDLFFADVTGDGRADIVARYFGPTAGLTGDIYVGISTGTSFAFSGRWTYGFSAGYNIYVADVSGDGKADLIARYYGPSAGTGNVYVMRSSGTAFVWDSFDPYTYGWGSTYDLLFKDVTGDGRADLIGRHTGNSDVYVASASATTFTFTFLGTWTTGVDTSKEIY